MKLEIDSAKDSAASIHKAIELLQMLAKEQGRAKPSYLETTRQENFYSSHSQEQEAQAAVGFASMFSQDSQQQTQVSQTATAPNFESFLGLVNSSKDEDKNKEEPTPKIQFF